MLDHVNLDKVLFLDIETVPQASDFNHLTGLEKDLWKHKARLLKHEVWESEEVIYNRAGIYAEFGKIICISVGYFDYEDKRRSFKIKSFFDDNEKSLLKEFSSFLQQNFNRSNQLLCAHNGKEFDFPYLCRRLLINKMKVPFILDIAGKKPWDVQHLDTLELWKFGDYKSYTPINLLANVFNIPSPKDDIDGSMVCKVYWQDKDLKRIAKYCQQDVLTVCRLLMSFKGLDIIDMQDVIYMQPEL